MRLSLSSAIILLHLQDLLHYVKTRSELAEAFVEDHSHTCEHIPNFLRHCGTESFFELRFRRPDGLFQVQLVQRVLGYEAVL